VNKADTDLPRYGKRWSFGLSITHGDPNTIEVKAVSEEVSDIIAEAVDQVHAEITQVRLKNLNCLVQDKLLLAALALLFCAFFILGNVTLI
jgi:hypothetical protein